MYTTVIHVLVFFPWKYFLCSISRGFTNYQLLIFLYLLHNYFSNCSKVSEKVCLEYCFWLLHFFLQKNHVLCWHKSYGCVLDIMTWFKMIVFFTKCWFLYISICFNCECFCNTVGHRWYSSIPFQKQTRKKCQMFCCCAVTDNLPSIH